MHIVKDYFDYGWGSGVFTAFSRRRERCVDLDTKLDVYVNMITSALLTMSLNFTVPLTTNYKYSILDLLSNGAEFEYFEEFPINLLPQFANITGRNPESSVLVVSLEYGANFSGPGNDIFRSDRAVGAPSLASASNFLHPVYYFYRTLPTADDFKTKDKKQTLPTPDHIHHTVEDFLTLWFSPITHILPLRRFLEAITVSDMRQHFAEQCMRLALSSRNLPFSCSRYASHRGLYAAMDQYRHAESLGISDNFPIFHSR